MPTTIFDPPTALLNSQGRLRHPNGNGSLFDQADADQNSYIDKHSKIHDVSRIRQSRITHSTIKGHTLTHKATIHNSYLDGEYVLNAFVTDSILTGLTEVWGSPMIENVQIHDLSVFGDARLIGEWALDGHLGRIGQGIWARPPRVIRYEDLSVTITESINGTAYVACRLHRISTWLNMGDAIGKKAGWAQWQVDRLRELFHSWLANPISANPQSDPSEAMSQEALSKT